jgi:hypothetical protein
MWARGGPCWLVCLACSSPASLGVLLHDHLRILNSPSLSKLMSL